jgi:hypothetical protein
MMGRRYLLTVLLAAVFVCSAAHAGQKKIYNVSGDITPSSYKGFEQFLLNSLDTIVGLKVSFPANEYTPGVVVAGANDGQFVAYFSGAGESEIVAVEGFQFLHGAYVFDGFFVVKSGGVHQGTVSLSLQKTDEAQVRLSNAAIIDIRAERLNSKYKKKN